MSNDWETLQAFDTDKKPIIMNGAVQSYGTLRESLRRINLTILENCAESSDLAWIEAREAELKNVESIFDRIREDNPWSSFISVFRDAESLTYVRKRDIKGDWGYDVNAIQFVSFPLALNRCGSDLDRQWTDLHYGEITKLRPPSTIVKFWFMYWRNPYGKWIQTFFSTTDPGQPLYVDFVGNGYDYDEKWKDTVSRFKGETICHCHEDHLQPDYHIYRPETPHSGATGLSPVLIN